MATVHHPTPDYSGAATIGRRTLTFSEGRAVLAGPAASWRRAGYRVAAEEEPVLLADMTVDQLREHAATAGVDLTGVTRKADIVAAITAGPVDSDGSDGQDG